MTHPAEVRGGGDARLPIPAALIALLGCAMFYAIAAYEGFRFAKVGVAKARFAREQAAAVPVPAVPMPDAFAPTEAEARQGDPP